MTEAYFKEGDRVRWGSAGLGTVVNMTWHTAMTLGLTADEHPHDRAVAVVMDDRPGVVMFVLPGYLVRESSDEAVINNSARSSTSALKPQGAVAWALQAHHFPDGTTWSVRQQSKSVLRLLAENGYRVVARDALAKAWEQGFATGSSRAMRKMSDEPGLKITAPNPYLDDDPEEHR